MKKLINDSSNSEKSARRKDYLIAATIGLCVALTTTIGLVSAGSTGGYEAKEILKVIMPTSRFLCSATITASSTTLALMLTLIGMTTQSEVKLSQSFYLRIALIARSNALLIIFSTFFLILQCVPLTKHSDLPLWWYPTFYYSFLAFIAFTGGLLSGVITLIYFAIKDLIQILGLRVDEHPLIQSE